MPGKTYLFSIIFSVMMLIAHCLSGCNNQATTEPIIGVTSTKAPILTPTQTNTPVPTNTLVTKSPYISTLSREYFASSTPSPTIDSTDQASRATAKAAYQTERAAIGQVLDNKATQIAQFPSACEDINSHASNVSPDGKWFAASCGYETNQRLIVQNREGTKWVLEFNNFLNPATPKEITGSLYPKFWSPEGEYLYFTSDLGYDGGGSMCFTRGGNYGLFRLNLKKGTSAILVPPAKTFPGYIIKFSPTGRHFAMNDYGLTIADLRTGEGTPIDMPGIVDFAWSPDGEQLAFSVASCGDFFVHSSSIYVWNVLTHQTQKLVTTDEILLKPEAWIDNSILRIYGETIDGKAPYIIYEYNIKQKDLLFSGTATPNVGPGL